MTEQRKTALIASITGITGQDGAQLQQDTLYVEDLVRGFSWLDRVASLEG